MNMKPMLKYSGGKAKEIPNILPYIPEFDGRYVEPFFGGGAMYFHLEPKKAIINDINAIIDDNIIFVVTLDTISSNDDKKHKIATIIHTL